MHTSIETSKLPVYARKKGSQSRDEAFQPECKAQSSLLFAERVGRGVAGKLTDELIAGACIKGD